MNGGSIHSDVTRRQPTSFRGVYCYNLLYNLAAVDQDQWWGKIAGHHEVVLFADFQEEKSEYCQPAGGDFPAPPSRPLPHSPAGLLKLSQS